MNIKYRHIAITIEDTENFNMKRQMLKLADRMARKFEGMPDPNSTRAQNVARNYHAIMRYVNKHSDVCDSCGCSNVKPDMLYLGDEHNVFLVLCKSCH